MKWNAWLAAALMIVLAAGCGTASIDDNTAATPAQPTSEPETAADAPARVVEQYLTAKVAGDRDTLAQTICSAMEARLDAEALSFNAVDASIEDMACSTDPSGATVTCSGRIVAVYGAENRDFPLGTYSVVEEDGAWRFCGETTAP
jgi:hypothetical protein